MANGNLLREGTTATAGRFLQHPSAKMDPHGLSAVGSFWLTAPHMAQHQKHGRVENFATPAMTQAFRISEDLLS